MVCVFYEGMPFGEKKAGKKFFLGTPSGEKLRAPIPGNNSFLMSICRVFAYSGKFNDKQWNPILYESSIILVGTVPLLIYGNCITKSVWQSQFRSA